MAGGSLVTRDEAVEACWGSCVASVGPELAERAAGQGRQAACGPCSMRARSQQRGAHRLGAQLGAEVSSLHAAAYALFGPGG